MSVKLVYDKYSITLRRLATMEATSNINLIKKHWYCPWFLRSRAYKNIMKDVHKIFGNDEEIKTLNDENLLLYMNRKRLIIEGSILSCRVEFNSDRCRELYRGATGRELLVAKNSTLACLDNLLLRAKLKANAQAAILNNENKSKNETRVGSYTIGSVITKIFLWNDVDLNMQLTLFELENLYNAAIEKAKNINKAEK